MATIKIIQRLNKLTKGGKAPIHFLITHNRKPSEVSIKRSIEPKYWDAERCIVKRSHPNSSVLNVYIKKEYRRLEQILDSFLTIGANFHVKDVVSEFRGKAVKTPTKLIPFIEKYSLDNPDGLAYNTLKNYSKTVSCLKDFDPNAKFSNVDLDFLEKYDRFLRDKGLAKNTIYDRFKVLRKIILLGERQNLIKDNPFKYFKIKAEETQREYLTIDELKLLENYTPKNASQELCKDVFLFSCYTGLRFSDICTLTNRNIVDNNGYKLRKRMSKTKTIVEFPLPQKAVEILNKYMNNSVIIFRELLQGAPLSNEKLLKNKISSRNAYLNKIIKDIIKACEIDKSISLHCARHTFATVGLTIGIRIEVLQKLLGHKNLKETQIYAKIVDEQKSDAMKLFDSI